MARYCLLQSVRIGTSTHLYGDILDDATQDLRPFIAEGVQWIKLPNQRVEDWAARLRYLRAKGSFDPQDAGFPMLPNTADQVVASVSDLTSVSGFDGERIFVLSLKDFFAWQSSWPVTTDHITVEATADGGTTRWVREMGFHPAWRTQISDIYIDPINGSDENQGIYASTPGSPKALKTGREFSRRWGQRNTFTASQDDGFGFKVIKIHILNTIPDPDLFNLDCIAGDELSYIWVLGENTTTAHSGTLDSSGGFTLWDPSASGGGTPNIIKDSSVSDWTPYLYKRIFFSRVNAWAYILKDLGGGSARISVPQFVDIATSGTPVPTNTFPANGDAYEIQTLVGVNLNPGDIDTFVNWEDINFTAPASSFGNLEIKAGLYNFAAQTFYRCTVDALYSNSETAPSVFFSNCRVNGLTEPNNSGVGNGGLGFYGGAVIGGGLVSGGLGDAGVLDYHATVQGGYVIIHGDTQVRAFSVFDATSSSDNPSGHAILIGTPGHHTSSGTVRFASRTQPIFGSGGVGVGVWVGQDSAVIWEQLPNIKGTAGTLKLGSGGKARFFNETTGKHSNVIDETADWNDIPNNFGGKAVNASENCSFKQVITG